MSATNNTPNNNTVLSQFLSAFVYYIDPDVILADMGSCLANVRSWFQQSSQTRMMSNEKELCVKKGLRQNHHAWIKEYPNYPPQKKLCNDDNYKCLSDHVSFVGSDCVFN